MRPGLDRLRDLVAQGDVNRIYIQSTDRLASGAKLTILVEEFLDNGVEIIFLRWSADETPEGKLLLHMQVQSQSTNGPRSSSARVAANFIGPDREPWWVAMGLMAIGSSVGPTLTANRKSPP